MKPALEENISARFPPEKKHLPYENEEEYTRELFSMVSYLLVSLASYREAIRENELAERPPELAMQDQEALNYLAEYPLSAALWNMGTCATSVDVLEHVESRLQHTPDAAVRFRLEMVRHRFRLGEFSFFCLVCAMTAETDRGFESLFSAFSPQTQTRCLLLGTVQALFSLLRSEYDAWDHRIEDPYSWENRFVFQTFPDAPPPQRPLAIRPHILAFLRRREYRAPDLWRHCTAVEKGGAPKRVFCKEQITLAERAMGSIAEHRASPILLALRGPKGSGKTMTLEILGAKLGVSFLQVDVDALSVLKDQEELVPELALTALLDRYVPAFTVESDTGAALLRTLLGELAPLGISVLLITRQARLSVDADKYLSLFIDYPDALHVDALAVWEHFVSEFPVSPDLNWKEMAGKYNLTTGQIRHALRDASELAALRGVAVDEKVLAEVILLNNSKGLAEVACAVETSYTWDDLVLGEASMRALKEICDRVKYRNLVEKQWGFSQKSCGKKGVAVLFYGPPGTGKTMSAQVLANELCLPLFRIDLAQIISKYIGETAKNLDHVFSEAESSNVILFFDEADSLFSKRTEVKDSNDRHANSESAYLLQKVEEYSGICILATNLFSNFDDAFRRRIQYFVNINMPSAKQRLLLWHKSFPDGAPLDHLDFGLLAEHLELSGSVIKSAARKAAYYAAAEGARIGMAHIARALRSELQQLGMVEPVFLRSYYTADADKT